MLPEVCTLRAPTISRLAHTRKVHWSSGSARCKPAVCTSTHSHANVATDTHTHSHMHAAALNSMPPFPGAAHGLYSVCPFEQSLPTQPLNHWGYGSRAERLFLDHGSRQRFLELKGSQYAHGTSTRRYLDNGDDERSARLRPAPRGVVSGSPERAEPGSPPVVPWLHINGLAGLCAPSLSRCRFYWLGSAWLLRLLAVLPLLCRSSVSPLPHSISAACGLPHSGVIAADTAGNVVIVSEEQLTAVRSPALAHLGSVVTLRAWPMADLAASRGSPVYKAKVVWTVTVAQGGRDPQLQGYCVHRERRR